MALNEMNKGVRRVLRNFVNAPSFENWARAIAFIDKSGTCPCEGAVLTKLGNERCDPSYCNDTCPLCESVGDDERTSCPFIIGEEDVASMLDFWDKRQGALVIGVFKFISLWK